jgi:hypothetical protein
LIKKNVQLVVETDPSNCSGTLAPACGYEGPINFGKGDYERLKQLDSDIQEGLSCTEFQEKVQEIVQAPGSTAERSRALENAIAHKECEVCAEHGLTPSFQGAIRFENKSSKMETA